MSEITLRELPPQDAPDYFRLLVRNCIETYKKLPNDEMCLNYNKVSGKLRARVLDDEEYQQETRNIYAQQRLAELDEVDNLAQLAFTDEDVEEDFDFENADPRSIVKPKPKPGVDKDRLNLRFKAAQMRRELIASLNDNNNAAERDAVNLSFVGVSREDIERNIRNEIEDGSADDALDELTNSKEEAPEGTSGKLRLKGQDRPLDDDAFFETLPDGEIIEK
jgi:hypothetical protein